MQSLEPLDAKTRYPEEHKQAVDNYAQAQVAFRGQKWEESIEFSKNVVAWLANLIVSPVEPLKYIHRVAPLPVLRVNGKGDTRMPEGLGQKLHARAGYPKTAIWLEIGHTTLATPEFRVLVTGALAAWLVETGFLSPAEAGALR